MVELERWALIRDFMICQHQRHNGGTHLGLLAATNVVLSEEMYERQLLLEIGQTHTDAHSWTGTEREPGRGGGLCRLIKPSIITL